MDFLVICLFLSIVAFRKQTHEDYLSLSSFTALKGLMALVVVDVYKRQALCTHSLASQVILLIKIVSPPSFENLSTCCRFCLPHCQSFLAHTAQLLSF